MIILKILFVLMVISIIWWVVQDSIVQTYRNWPRYEDKYPDGDDAGSNSFT